MHYPAVRSVSVEAAFCGSPEDDKNNIADTIFADTP